MESKDPIASWHVGVAAEACAAALFARCGLDVSAQYGANKLGYDLIVVRGERMLRVSVKGSKDAGWGLAQSSHIDANNGAAIYAWLARHMPRTVFCFIQYAEVPVDQMPRAYLATPMEVAEHLKASASGRGDSVVHKIEDRRAKATGARRPAKIPESWRFSAERVEELLVEA